MSKPERTISDVLSFLNRIGEEYKNKMADILAGTGPDKEACKECLAELAARTLGALQAYAEMNESFLTKNYTNEQVTWHRPKEYQKINRILQAIKKTARYEFQKYAKSENKNHPFKKTEYSLKASKFLYWFTEAYVERRFDRSAFRKLPKDERRNLIHWYMKVNTCGNCKNPYTDNMFIDYDEQSGFAPFNSRRRWDDNINHFPHKNFSTKIFNIDELRGKSPNAANLVENCRREQQEKTELLEECFESGKRNEQLFPSVEELGR